MDYDLKAFTKLHQARGFSGGINHEKRNAFKDHANHEMTAQGVSGAAVFQIRFMDEAYAVFFMRTKKSYFAILAQPQQLEPQPDRRRRAVCHITFRSVLIGSTPLCILHSANKFLPMMLARASDRPLTIPLGVWPTLGSWKRARPRPRRPSRQCRGQVLSFVYTCDHVSRV